jgi:hypothetical protein
VLNRLFIIIGVVAILAIAAAFVVPSLVPWGHYRDRLAEIAGGVVGEPVRIEGDVAFSLLPQPKLSFSKVSAGPPEAPTMSVETVEAEFSLIDFIRDRYNVTGVLLQGLSVRLDIEGDGSIRPGLSLFEEIPENITVSRARIVDGTVAVTDARSDRTFTLSGIGGDVRIEALRGPLSFQGTGNHAGKSYALRVATGELDADGGGALAVALRPTDDAFSFSAEGVMTAGGAPSFAGTMTWRQPPQPGGSNGAVDAGQGHLLMTSNVSATTSRVLLTDYVVVPDENRAATRLQGAAEIAIGPQPSFNAVISGGVVALPPRDATAEQAVGPYDLLRLLTELPAPPVPPMPGTIGVDLAEVNLRSFGLRNFRLDASVSDGAWTIQRLTGVLPGDTRVTFAGQVGTVRGRLEFGGDISLRAARLDVLSTLWRRPAEGNPLFGMPGGVAARLDRVGETLSVSRARLELDGTEVPFSAQIGLGANRDLRLDAQLGDLDGQRSDALLAFLPDLSADAGFAVTFPRGAFRLGAGSAEFAGLPGRNLKAHGSWDGGVLVVDELSADDFGGVAFNAALTAFGTLLKPELSGTATLSVTSTDAPALDRLYAAMGVSEAVAAFLDQSLPAELALTLGGPSGDGAQSLEVSGLAGGATVTADAQLTAGFLRALSGPVALRLDMRSADVSELTRQLGFATTELFPAGAPGHLAAQVNGDIAKNLTATVLLESGDDSLGFSGNLVVTDPAAYKGRGTLKAELSDPTALVEAAGVGGVSLPGLSASASVVFDGADDVVVENLEGMSGGEVFSGRLGLSLRAGTRTISGTLDLGRLTAADIWRTLAGPAALLPGDGIWPEGPLDIGTVPRPTSGRIAITAPVVDLGDVGMTDFSGALDWDATTTRLRNATAKIGDGTVRLDLTLCCAGSLTAKQVTGRYTLAGVDIDAIAPAAVADALSGRVDANGRIDGTGESLGGVLEALTGEGTFNLKPFEIARLDAQAPASINGIANILELQPEELVGVLEDRLDDGPFLSPEVAGTFTIAGGVLRSPNLPIEGQAGRLFGSGSIRLSDLGLNGSYTLSPMVATPAAAADAGTGQVALRIGGTLLAPEREFDVSALVDAMMVKAFEAEVARLEKLRAEDEARRQAEEAERARLAADAAAAEAQRRADEAAAARAAEEAAAAEAARRAAEDEATRRAAEEALRDRPLDLGLGN